MGKHAVIGNSQVGRKNTVLKQASRNMSSQPLTLGRDVNLPGDKRGYMGASLPMTAVYNLKADAVGAEFKSRLAKSIVTVGDWHKNDRGSWVIATVKHGLLRVSKGIVTLNRDVLGYTDMTSLTSKSGREDLITAVIAGTLAKAPIKRDNSTVSVARPEKAYTGGDVTAFVVYAVKGDRKIRYTVPEGKTCGEIVDDMILKGYDIVRIANS